MDAGLLSCWPPATQSLYNYRLCRPREQRRTHRLEGPFPFTDTISTLKGMTRREVSKQLYCSTMLLTASASEHIYRSSCPHQPHTRILASIQPKQPADTDLTVSHAVSRAARTQRTSTEPVDTNKIAVICRERCKAAGGTHNVIYSTYD
jgi:hypothetical protein